mgnify:FL=1
MFPAVKVLMVAVNAERILEKNDVVVALVAVNSVAVVVARVAVLDTFMLVKNEDTAESTEAKNEDEVALAKVVLPVAVKVVTEVEAKVALFETVMSVKNEVTAVRRVVKKLVEAKLVEVALVLRSVVMVPDALVSSVMVVVASVVLPVTEKLPAVVVEARSERKLVFSTQLTPFQ